MPRTRASLRISKPCLILGSAACVWEDVAALPAAFVGAASVIAINRVGIFYEGRIDHWISLHPEFLWDFIGWRRGNSDFETWSSKHFPPHSYDHIVAEKYAGASGLYAIQIAVESLDLDRIVLAGMPLDNQQYHFSSGQPWINDAAIGSVRNGWSRASKHFEGRVRSLSGWTSKHFGKPSASWLGQGPGDYRV